MKTIMLASLVFLGGVASHAQPPKSPLEGTWKLISGKWVVGAREYTLLRNNSGSQMKAYSKGHFLFVGKFEIDGKMQDNWGGGTYSVKGEDYLETILYHSYAEAVGRTFHFRLILKGDTMTVTGPVNPDDRETLGAQLTETYVRKD